MSDISDSRQNITIEETQYRAAVSESTMQKVGGSINFINNRQYDTKAFFMNGPYNLTGTNETAVDGLYVFPVNATIWFCAMFNITAGSSGTTTLDVKYASSSGGSFSTIFTTKPAIASTAGNNAWIYTGGSGTGLTAPVITPNYISSTTGNVFDVVAGGAIRVDFTGKQTGAENCGLLIYIRPR